MPHPLTRPAMGADEAAEPVAVRVTEQQRELIDALAAELGVEADEAVRYGFDAFLRQQP